MPAPCKANRQGKIMTDGLVRLNRLADLMLPETSHLRHSPLVCLVATKQRDTKATEIHSLYASRSV